MPCAAGVVGHFRSADSAALGIAHRVEVWGTARPAAAAPRRPPGGSGLESGAERATHAADVAEDRLERAGGHARHLVLVHVVELAAPSRPSIDHAVAPGRDLIPGPVGNSDEAISVASVAVLIAKLPSESMPSAVPYLPISPLKGCVPGTSMSV